MGNKGGAWAAKSMTQSLDNKRSCNLMLWTCLTMGTRPPSLLLLSAHAKPLHLCKIMLRMMSLMAAMQLGVPVSRVQGRQLGGRAMQSAIVVGGGGGCGGGRRTQKTTNIKRWGWDWSSEVWTLFEGNPARPSHPLHVETENKLGNCMLKVRCRNCHSLISYHNSSWTSAATHIRSHNITTAQDIAATAALAAESEANGEAFPIHKLLAPPPVKKEAARDAALM